MATREIDENEYAELQRVAKVAKLIGDNPKAREMLQQAVAIAAPEQAGAEIRIRQELTEKLSTFENKLSEFLDAQKTEKEQAAADRAQRDLERRWSDGRSKARDAGYTDDGLEKLEAFMEKNGVADHTLAIPAFERLNPPPAPEITGGSRWNFFDQASMANDEALKVLLDGNDESFLQMTIPQALKDVRG